MPPPGHAPFLRAICENPSDDAPRLVYADWLDEHGDAERARFIRLMVAWVRDPARRARSPGLSPDVLAFMLRQSEQLRAELPRLSGVHFTRIDRGFYSEVIVDRWKHYRRQADQLFCAVPVSALTVYGLNDPALAGLSQSPYLDRLSHLKLVRPASGLSPAGWRALAECPTRACLQEITVADDPWSFTPTRRPVVDLRAARVLGTLAAWPNLRWLTLTYSASHDAVEFLRTRLGDRLRSYPQATS
jgi:uncharacterized protein (TIGR02996 family)